MKSAEKMRLITQHVERSSQEQARGGRQITGAIENISNRVSMLSISHKAQTHESQALTEALRRMEDSGQRQSDAVKFLGGSFERLQKALGPRS